MERLYFGLAILLIYVFAILNVILYRHMVRGYLNRGRNGAGFYSMACVLIFVSSLTLAGILACGILTVAYEATLNFLGILG